MSCFMLLYLAPMASVTSRGVMGFLWRLMVSRISARSFERWTSPASPSIVQVAVLRFHAKAYCVGSSMSRPSTNRVGPLLPGVRLRIMNPSTPAVLSPRAST